MSLAGMTIVPMSFIPGLISNSNRLRDSFFRFALHHHLTDASRLVIYSEGVFTNGNVFDHDLPLLIANWMRKDDQALTTRLSSKGEYYIAPSSTIPGSLSVSSTLDILILKTLAISRLGKPRIEAWSHVKTSFQKVKLRGMTGIPLFIPLGQLGLSESMTIFAAAITYKFGARVGGKFRG